MWVLYPIITIAEKDGTDGEGNTGSYTSLVNCYSMQIAKKRQKLKF